MGRYPVARYKSSFPCVKNQRSDFAANHRDTSIPRNWYEKQWAQPRSGLRASVPLSGRLRCLPTAPRGRTPSLTEPRRGDRKGAGQTMASAAAQRAPRVLGRRRPGDPPENAPQNLRGSQNHRCRGAAAASATGPRIPGHGRREK